MNDFLFTVSQNTNLFLICLIFFFFIFYISQHFYTLKRMFDNDANYEERYEAGHIKVKGYHRNIWDLSLFPPLSKLFFTTDRKIVIAVCLLLFFLVLYLVTKEQWLAELVKVNFGLVIGALIGKTADAKG